MLGRTGAALVLLLLAPTVLALEVERPPAVEGTYLGLRPVDGRSDPRPSLTTSWIATDVATKMRPNLTAYAAGAAIASITWYNATVQLKLPDGRDFRGALGTEEVVLHRADDHARIVTEKRYWRGNAENVPQTTSIHFTVYDEPCAYWVYPIRENASWDVACTGTTTRTDAEGSSRENVNLAMRVIGTRNVTTMAGSFEALVVLESPRFSTVTVEHLLAPGGCGVVARNETAGGRSELLEARYLRCAASGIDTWAGDQPQVVRARLTTEDSAAGGSGAHSDLTTLAGGSNWWLLVLLAVAILVGVALAMRKKKEKRPPAAP